MSLILDALKKLEQEKAARRARQVEIRPSITGRRETPSPPPWRLGVLVAIAVILAVAVTISVMGPFSRQPPPAASVPVPSRTEPLQPAAPSIDAPRSVDAPAPPVQLPAALSAPAAPARRSGPEAVAPHGQRHDTAAADSNAPAPADLKVTGIAWQDERAARRAVVNGTLAGEGAGVAGARIVEIRQDQVRFSRDGQTFAVPITSANR